MINKILVIGGTGMLGQPVTARLLIDGYDVRVLTHSPEKAKLIFGNNVEIVEGDVTDINSLATPMTGCDAVYINLNAKMNPPDYERLEYRGTANVAEVASQQGIKHIAMISGLNVSLENARYPFVEAKLKAEQALIDSGVPYTIFRCCWFFESLPLFVVGKRAMVFGKQSHSRAWMAALDYAAMVSKAFQTDEAQNKIFHVRGIDRHTIPEALAGFCRIAFPQAKLHSVPLWLMSTVSLLSGKAASRGVAQYMKFFDAIPDADTIDEAERILGPALTALKDWSEGYKIRMSAK